MKMTSAGKALSQRQRTITLILLALAMVVATLLRTHGILDQTLTTDGLTTWYWANKPLSEHFRIAWYQDQHPPGYIYLLSIVIKLFGDSWTTLRLPSVILGVLVLPVFYLFGRRLFSEREGLVAAWLAAVLWQPVYYSQIVRQYSLMLFLAVTTTYLWYLLVLKLAEGERLPRPTLLLYLVLSSAIMWADYFGAILLGFHGITALLQVLRRPRARWTVVGMYTAIGLSYVAWIPAILRHGQLEVPRLQRHGPEFLFQ